MELNHKLGFTMIEALCSISILSILLLFAFSLRISVYKLKYRNDVNCANTEIIEQLANDFNECGYTKINGYSKYIQYYIPNDKLDTDIISKIHIISISQTVKPDNYPYVQYYIEEDNSILKIMITLTYKIYDRVETKKCDVYLGQY